MMWAQRVKKPGTEKPRFQKFKTFAKNIRPLIITFGAIFAASALIIAMQVYTWKKQIRNELSTMDKKPEITEHLQQRRAFTIKYLEDLSKEGDPKVSKAAAMILKIEQKKK